MDQKDFQYCKRQSCMLVLFYFARRGQLNGKAEQKYNGQEKPGREAHYLLFFLLNTFDCSEVETGIIISFSAF